VTVRRLAAIVLIFAGATAAWMILGGSLLARTGSFDSRLEQEVELLWGRPHHQVAVSAWMLRPGVESETVERQAPDGTVFQQQITRAVFHDVPVVLDRTRASVDLQLEHRQRGLLWYPTYTVAFRATYEFRNPDGEPRQVRIRFPVPAPDALLDDFVLTLNGEPVTLGPDASREITAHTLAEPSGPVTADVRYASRGIRQWTYAFAESGVTNVRDFELAARTSFSNVDFPPGSMSPDTLTQHETGADLAWRFDNLISARTIGVEMPERLNPGPFAARVTFFAPVSLLFFVTVMVIVGATSGITLHPMHYWFISAAFFAFHLLLAYLVDHVNLHVAFALASTTSVVLVFTYLRAIAGARPIASGAAAAQVVFLVLFSYAFFLEGFTGLTITIAAIVTLFLLMQATARVSWDDVFAESPARTVEGHHASR
jgi:hypothetical protein